MLLVTIRYIYLKKSTDSWKSGLYVSCSPYLVCRDCLRLPSACLMREIWVMELVFVRSLAILVGFTVLSHCEVNDPLFWNIDLTLLLTIHIRQYLFAVPPMCDNISDALGLSQIAMITGALTRTSVFRCESYITMPSVSS